MPDKLQWESETGRTTNAGLLKFTTHLSYAAVSTDEIVITATVVTGSGTVAVEPESKEVLRAGDAVSIPTTVTKSKPSDEVAVVYTLGAAAPVTVYV